MPLDCAPNVFLPETTNMLPLFACFLVPISLYLSIEIVKLFQAVFISCDGEMYAFPNNHFKFTILSFSHITQQ